MGEARVREMLKEVSARTLPTDKVTIDDVLKSLDVPSEAKAGLKALVKEQADLAAEFDTHADVPAPRAQQALGKIKEAFDLAAAGPTKPSDTVAVEMARPSALLATVETQVAEGQPVPWSTLDTLCEATVRTVIITLVTGFVFGPAVALFAHADLAEKVVEGFTAGFAGGVAGEAAKYATRDRQPLPASPAAANPSGSPDTTTPHKAPSLDDAEEEIPLRYKMLDIDWAGEEIPPPHKSL